LSVSVTVVSNLATPDAPPKWRMKYVPGGTPARLRESVLLRSLFTMTREVFCPSVEA
jgi:hypothetical protein